MIHRLADLAELAVVLKCCAAELVSQRVLNLDFQLCVVAPLVRIADLIGNALQFLLRPVFVAADIQSSWSMSWSIAFSISWTISSIFALLSPAKYCET